MIERRTLIGGIALAGAMVGAPLLFAKPGKRPLAEPGWRLSDAAWKKRLTPFQYKVLREAATERPFTSPLNDEHRAGIFACAGCALPLYSNRPKFESGERKSVVQGKQVAVRVNLGGRLIIHKKKHKKNRYIPT